MAHCRKGSGVYHSEEGAHLSRLERAAYCSRASEALEEANCAAVQRTSACTCISWAALRSSGGQSVCSKGRHACGSAAVSQTSHGVARLAL